MLVSGKSAAALRALAGRYAEHLRATPAVRLEDVALTSSVGRAHFNYRGAVRAASVDEACERLEALRAARPAAACSWARRAARRRRWPSSSAAKGRSTPAWAGSSTRTNRSSAASWTAARTLLRDELPLSLARRALRRHGRAARSDRLHAAGALRRCNGPWRRSGGAGACGRRGSWATAWANTRRPPWRASSRWKTACG